MKRTLMDRLSGWVLVEIRGMYAGRVLDGCAREGLRVHDIRAEAGQRLCATVALPDFPRLRPLIRRNACRLHIRARGGLPFYTERLRGRFAFPVGLAASLAVFWALTGFIWSMEVTGNRTLSAGQILRAVEPYGVVRGARISSIHNEELRNRVLCDVPELSFITVRFEGSHAVIEVRERRVPPEVANEHEVCDIVAGQSGMITMLHARQGTARVQKGQLVEAGELLVAGELRYRTNPGGYMTHAEYEEVPCRADAEVYARVWQTARAACPLETCEKVPSGRERTRWALVLGSRRIALSRDIFSGGCDILISRYALEPLPGVRLPVTLVRERCIYYDRVPALSDERALTEALTEQARMRLESMTAGERLTVNHVRTAVLHGTVYASVTGETVRDIAVKRVRP